MPSIANVFEKMKNRMFKSYSGDAGKMLLHTGTIGWLVSSAAQVFAIMVNDKVSKEQKKFMIPQEMADAAINILAFYTLTDSIQNITKRLVSSGKFITPAIKAKCGEYGIAIVKDDEGNIPNIGKAILEKIKEFESTLKVDKQEGINIKPIEIKKLESKRDDLKEFNNKHYSPLESGFKIIGNVIGVIVSSNIVTPLLRNPFAAARQKQAIQLEKMEDFMAQNASQNDSQGLSPYSPVIPNQSKFGIDDYKKQASLNISRTSSGGMKI